MWLEQKHQAQHRASPNSQLCLYFSPKPLLGRSMPSTAWAPPIFPPHFPILCDLLGFPAPLLLLMLHWDLSRFFEQEAGSLHSLGWTHFSGSLSQRLEVGVAADPRNSSGGKGSMEYAAWGWRGRD